MKGIGKSIVAEIVASCSDKARKCINMIQLSHLNQISSVVEDIKHHLSDVGRV
jgi:hypothetical protein